MIRSRGNAEALGLVSGFSLWALGFVALYAGHGFACGMGVRLGYFDDVTRLALVLAFFGFVVAHLWLDWWFWRRWCSAETPSIRFVRFASFALAITATASTLWTGAPVVFLSICG